MTEERKRELVTAIGRTRRELNQALSQAHAAGLKVEADVLESCSLGDKHNHISIVTHVFEKLD